ncbi:UDP-N-acetylmuramate dehydrogenase [Agromyces sp. SYSU T00194]|uniref:UDP-N-acetylmuramate dehydrogenase n=1 Tax=Agromyces chitinivorans TaxID=3158560 RepID=UPI003391F506
MTDAATSSPAQGGDALPLSELTTLRVGGPAARMVTATTEDELVALARETWEAGGPWLALGGGSNLLVGDDGVPGTVIRVATTGIATRAGGEPNTVHLRVQAGERWDDLVAYTVSRGWSGIEALSGIPGSVGAAPVQNIGAYGQELVSVLVAIDFLEEDADAPRRMTADELELGYRTSVLKQGLRGIVTAVELELHDTAPERDVLGGALGVPIAYAQLANALGVQLGDRVPVEQVRSAVLALRASKGMVLDPDDHDSWSAGSFFTNPIVTEHVARTMPSDAPRWYVEPETPPEVVPLTGLDESPLDQFLAHQAEAEASAAEPDAAEPAGEVQVKLSAAWLIEHSGIHRGFALPGSHAAVSSRHTLALTNRGGASADELVQLARFVRSRVQAEFGILLEPEPVLVGTEL